MNEDRNPTTLSPAMRRMLDRIVRHDGVILESQISASGRSSSKCLNDLLVAGLVDITAHPTVRERGGAPAAAVVPTAKGRVA